MKAEQTSLFHVKPSQKETKPITKVQTKADQAYQALCKVHLSQKLHIYNQQGCKSIVLAYVNQILGTYGEDTEAISKQYQKTSPYGYYHYDGKRFIRYNGWIMNQIRKDFLKHDKPAK